MSPIVKDCLVAPYVDMTTAKGLVLQLHFLRAVVAGAALGLLAAIAVMKVWPVEPGHGFQIRVIWEAYAAPKSGVPGDLHDGRRAP